MMFNFIRKLFSRKKNDKNNAEHVQEIVQQLQEPAQPVIAEPVQEKVQEIKPAQPDPDRKEKICQNCGAPNDTFVDKCWLCKKGI